MAAAFKMIMRKKIDEGDDVVPDKKASVTSSARKPTAETILAKYKKKTRDLDELKAKEEVERKKAALKEKQRLMEEKQSLMNDVAVLEDNTYDGPCEPRRNGWIH